MFYCAAKPFNHMDGDAWLSYVHWLGREDLRQVVTLDSILCPSLIQLETEEDWRYVVQEDFMLDFFHDLDYVLARTACIPTKNVLAAARNPTTTEVSGFLNPDFEFAGFDVVDVGGGISAILDCGGFPEVFSLSELSANTGLICSLQRANQIRDTLARLYPDGDHTNCHVWALWRYLRDA